MDIQRSPRLSRTHNSQRACPRCKWKKIKCDETSPACQNCVNDGADCPGFVPPLRWSSKHEKFNRQAVEKNSRKAKRNAKTQQTAEQRIIEGERMHISDARGVIVTEQETFPFETVSSWRSQVPVSPIKLHLPDFERLGSENRSSVALNENLVMSGSPLSDQHLENHESRSSQSLDESPLISLGAIESIEQVQSVYDGQELRGTNNNSSLLGTFYRLLLPTPIARFSDDHLVIHYFSAVSPLYSCFDSPLNPFRSLVTKLWMTSTTISVAIQSMAIAHLANHYLYMAPFGEIKRSQAWRSLQSDLQLHQAGKLPLETVLISLLLLGPSSTWHASSNLGLHYLSIARNLIQTYLHDPASRRPPLMVLSDEKFFLDALMYWEMLATFVDPVPMATFPGFGTPCPAPPADQQQMLPHAWTGINSEVTFALAEIGRILRRRRGLAMLTPTHIDEKPWCEDDEQWASSLESFLISVKIPQLDDIADFGDDDTSKLDLIRAADAQRYVGLLEIYHAFPRCLDRRTCRAEFPPSYGRKFLAPTDHSSYSKLRDSWLCAIAIYTLHLINETPICSGGCRLHPLILISCASQLRTPDCSETMLDEVHVVRQAAVCEQRQFIEQRMLALSRKYAQKPALQMLDVIKEVWHRLDNGDENAHWLDVTHSKGWQTMIG